ncbi:hypothetical protein K469DRAFT_693775 [Zopfia rhizophila CBS 207.26]|uniref:Uncharacterized protein n=1 Tax=Zopfia rhizophila CBS 207.26 TaxID=1314779 RepID=A0A6A6DQG2_9PEZI|nr:hypothetical protein K469DRAFT_693775 [Zopfia rhizophila CBS 207.26]
MDPLIRVSSSRQGSLSTTSPPPQASRKAPKKSSKKVTKKAQHRLARSPIAPPLPPPSPLFVRSSPPPSAQPDEIEYEDEDEDEDGTPPLPVPIKFISRWKAVAGREVLTGAQSQKLNTERLFYHSAIT